MKQNYLFIIDRLENGGAERQMLNIARYVSTNKTIFITSLHTPSDCFLNKIKESGFIYLPISKTNGVSLLKKVLGILGLIRALKNLVKEKQIDKCISFLEWSNILTIIALRGTVIPVCINIRNHLSTQYGVRSLLILKIAQVIIRKIYPLANTIVCNSYGIRDDLRDKFLVPADKITVIQNSYDIDKIKQYAQGSDYKRNIKLFCASGRLSDQKRFESLILSFQSYIEQSHRSDVLFIIGSGPNHKSIRDLIDKGTADIKLLAHQDNLLYSLSQCDCFILHSDFEGFPNVLAEAIILGKDCISVDCMTGPRELMTGNSLTDYNVPIREIKLTKFGLLYPYHNLGKEPDKNLINALHQYTANDYNFDRGDYNFLCEKEGNKKWLNIL